MNRKKIIILPLIIIICSCSNSHYNQYKYYHQQGRNDYSDYFYYDDSFFDKPSTELNPHLASASICFAEASFASTRTDVYAKKSMNAEDFLQKIGFTNFATNDFYKTKPSTDSIGVLAANKIIGDYTVIALGTRGAGYTSEWASNVSLGNRIDGYHDGFRRSADYYIDFAKEYISSNNIQGKIKIWTAGYSRGGAVVNLASGLITEKINNNEKPLGDAIELSRENLYVYCFEAPMGAPNTKDDNGNIIVRGESFNNIFNFININDVVPLTAMKELGFTRFGKDIYLPDPLTNLDYENHFKNMNSIYNSLSNHSQLGEYDIFNFEYKMRKGFGVETDEGIHAASQGIFIREFLSDLVNFGMTLGNTIPLDGCLNHYANNVQTGLRNAFSVVYESDIFKGSLMDLGLAMVNDLGIINEIDYLISDLLVEGPKAFIADFKPILARALNKLALDVDVKVTVNNLVNFLEILGNQLYMSFFDGKLYELLNWISKDNIKSIASGHYPELCMSHVKALDDNYVNNPYTNYEKLTGQYYQLIVEDVESSIVISTNNKVIVNINNGKEINNRITYMKRTDCYEIYLPYHEQYEVILGDDVPVELNYWSYQQEKLLPISVELKENYSFEIK